MPCPDGRTARHEQLERGGQPLSIWRGVSTPALPAANSIASGIPSRRVHNRAMSSAFSSLHRRSGPHLPRAVQEERDAGNSGQRGARRVLSARRRAIVAGRPHQWLEG